VDAAWVWSWASIPSMADAPSWRGVFISGNALEFKNCDMFIGASMLENSNGDLDQGKSQPEKLAKIND
jgi:hypothetical protein